MKDRSTWELAHIPVPEEKTSESETLTHVALRRPALIGA
jgi:hypothetical protein